MPSVAEAVQPGSLRVRVEEAWPTAIVAVSGVLRHDGLAGLRSVMRTCLADCPDAVVIDLTGMDVDGDEPLHVFGGLRREAAVWPAIPVLLCAASADVSDRLDHVGLARSMPVCPDRASAVSAARGAPTIARYDRDLGAGAGAPAEARRMIARLCARWGLDGLAERAQLVISELVTNAVVHATGRIRVTTLIRRPYLHLIVQDQNPEPPRSPPAAVPLDASWLTPGGRGLRLVGQVATGWGHLVNAGGKAVWARLRIPPGEQPPDPTGDGAAGVQRAG